jgi:integrase
MEQQWTDKTVKSFKPRTKAYMRSEDTNKRGVGRLVLEVMPITSEQAEGKGISDRHLYFAYFQKQPNGKSKRVLIKLGTFKKTPRASGICLQDARTKQLNFEKLLRDGIDPKAYLTEKELEEQARTRKIVQKKSHGTFDDLLHSYTNKMESDGKRSVQKIRRSLKTYVRDPFPELLPLKANEISVDDIELIIARMINKGVTTHCNRVRAFLHAGFQHGLKQEHNPRRYSNERIKFNLTSNPVSAIPIQKDYERVSDYVIPEKDIKEIWTELPKKSQIAGWAVKLALCTGQRLGELVRVKWSDLDFDEHTMTIPASVSKNKKAHLVPLVGLAWEVIAEMKIATGNHEFLFPSTRKDKYNDGKPIYSNTITAKIREFCSENNVVQKFIARDIRRTWKTLTGKAGISKTIRDRCQNHALSDVSTKHYDRYEYQTEKLAAMKTWDSYLRTIVYPTEKIIHIKKSA